jgi:hypothetical protein
MKRNNYSMGSAGLLSADGTAAPTANVSGAGGSSHRLISPYQDEAQKFIT